MKILSVITIPHVVLNPVTPTILTMPLLTFLGWQMKVVIQLSDFIKNIIICVLKMNESLTGLEQHECE